MSEKQNAKTTIAVRPLLRDCQTCRIRDLAARTGLCSLCASLVQSCENGGHVWVYLRPILEDEAIIHVLPKDLAKPPKLLLSE